MKGKSIVINDYDREYCYEINSEAVLNNDLGFIKAVCDKQPDDTRAFTVKLARMIAELYPEENEGNR